MTRRYVGLLFIVLAIVIWIPSGDVIDMIIRQKEIVFGRYSRGHFGALFILTLLLLGMSALCFSKIKTVGEMVLVGVMVLFSTLASGFVLVVFSGMFATPRYIETQVGNKKSGIIRHGQPGEFFNLRNKDVPEQHRSYPHAPPGYPTFDLTLTTDQDGFRNLTRLDHYPVLAVGDSFVAGSHVSDEQTWVHLLGQQLKTDIYNLGVSGTDPGIYLNNFVMSGRQLKPKLVLFMIYEGNDFKDISPIVLDERRESRTADATKKDHPKKEKRQKKQKRSWPEKISYWAEASPVTRGLRRLSSEHLERIGQDNPVPGYEEAVGWMPLKFHTEHGDQYFGFEPKRLIYLYEEKDKFKNSKSWQSLTHIMQSMVAMGEEDGFKVVFVYAPSTPHVVMPLVRDAIPADQLRNFAAYQQKDLPAADEFKQEVFERMDNEQQVFLDECHAQQWSCLSLTKAMQDAMQQGEQVYYSYDQHWTPEGHRIAADALRTWISNRHL